MWEKNAARDDRAGDIKYPTNGICQPINFQPNKCTEDGKQFFQNKKKNEEGVNKASKMPLPEKACLFIIVSPNPQRLLESNQV